VARFNTQTNTWSTLGTGSSNGVNYEVSCAGGVGNEVVVGGLFTSAGGVSANNVARFNTQTNTWSTLGTGSSNGVNGVFVRWRWWAMRCMWAALSHRQAG
jgi:N-acetylneuraminic acid mutarotase